MASRAPALASPRRQKLIFWAALLLIAAVSLLSFLSTQQLLSTTRRVEHNQSVLLALGDVLSNLKDVETGSRGYVITSNPAYLEPYQVGLARYDESLARLHRLARDDAALDRTLGRLEPLGRERIAAARQVVRRSSAGMNGDGLSGTLAQGRTTMDRIREEVSATIAARQERYRRQRETLETQSRMTSTALGTGIVLSLIAISWLFALRGREVARRREVEGELRILTAELEERVQERTVEVERSRRLLDAVVENIPDTIFLKDAGDEFRYVLVNEAAEKLLGRPRSDLLGHVDRELFPRVEARLCRKEDEEVAESGHPHSISERPFKTDGGVRLIESRKVPVALDHADKVFVLGIVRDVTQQRSLEVQVREMQRMEAVGRLTGGIAHDFNNLLAIIMGSLELVRERLADGSETAVIADEALEAAARGAELVRRLLAFARKQHLEPSSVDLNERLPHIVPLLRRSLGENIRIQVKTQPDLWKAMIDPTQVDDAVVNLAINSRDAMPHGGTLTIETSNEILDEDYAAQHVEVEPGEYVMLAVSDTGSGMTPEVMARAFEPFFTTKAERGTGLGLSQVFGWVKQSGGHIKIYSEAGHGTTMKLYLPRSAEEGERATEGEPAAAAGVGNETIFVVEDNANVRRTVLRQLTDLGYRTIEAEDAESALEAVRQGARFDLLLTDVVMPGGMTGYELADEMARLVPGAKVLFTSGYTELSEGNRPNSRSGPLISKPFRKQELGQQIRAVLDNEA